MPLTILSNADGTVTVKAAVANGLQGFWYSLFSSDELGGAWSVVTSGEYVSGVASEQAQQTQAVELSIDVDPAEAKRFYKLVVTEKDPSK